MFRLWGKQFKNGRLEKDLVIEKDENISRTKKVFSSLEEICESFDLSKPIWLDDNIQEFRRLGKTRFYQDHFIESIPFDFLEIHIIEE